MHYRKFISNPKVNESDGSYFGSIEGLPEAGLIEARTIDMFEEKFHLAVDSHIQEKARKSKLTKRWITWGIVGGIVLALILTCPDKEKHIVKVTQEMPSYFGKAISENSDGLDIIGALLGSAFVNKIVESCMVVDNYYIFNVGKIVLDGESKPVSIGILGHVFTTFGSAVEDSVNEVGEDLEALIESLGRNGKDTDGKK